MKHLNIFAFLILLSLLAACGRTDSGTHAAEEYGTSEEEAHYTPDYTPIPYDSPLHDVFTSGRTRGEYLEDLDFLYTTLLENYPFFGAVLRSYGVDLHTRYLETREHIETRNDFPSDEHFAATLNNFFIRNAQHIGHLSILDSDSLLHHIHSFSHGVELGSIYLQPFLDELNNPATRALHGLTDADFIPPPYGVESAVFAATSDNIHTYIIEEGRIAYVSIFAMSYATMEIDRVTLLDFFYQVTNYDHLIIDIRQNSGGGGPYFLDLVMSPNISYPLTFRNYVFLMGGEHSRRILGAWFDAEDFVRPINHDVIARMPYFHPDDVHMLNYYLRGYSYIEPSHDTGIFSGKIWLLVGPWNFSAAEFALAVAKQTGFATLVGLPTGGGGLGLQPLLLALPNTGIVVRYAAGYGVGEYGRESYEHGTQPHYLNRPGMDALETVLAMIEEGSY